MLNFMLRMFFLCFGAVIACDALLPTATQTLQIVGHKVGSSNKGLSSNYSIHFDNVRLHACPVSKKNYYRLNDGDLLVVKSTRLLKQCIKIERDGVEIKSSSVWRLFNLLLGAGFIAYGVGWFRPEKYWPWSR